MGGAVTAPLWLRLWPCATIGILLITELGFPFAPLRRWAATARHLAVVGDDGDPTWLVVERGARIGEPTKDKRQAVALLSWPDRFRAWLAEMWDCPWCTGAWVTIVGVCVFVPGGAWDRLSWWPALWAASSGACVAFGAMAAASKAVEE